MNKMISVLAIATLPAWAIAAGDHGTMIAASAPASGHDMAGMQGMHSEMHDTMRFTPGSVKAGETLRFFVVNKGGLPHEILIGTAEEIDEHAEMMMKMPGMVHKEFGMVGTVKVN